MLPEERTSHVHDSAALLVPITTLEVLEQVPTAGATVAWAARREITLIPAGSRHALYNPNETEFIALEIDFVSSPRAPSLRPRFSEQVSEQFWRLGEASIGRLLLAPGNTANLPCDGQIIATTPVTITREGHPTSEIKRLHVANISANTAIRNLSDATAIIIAACKPR